MLAWVLAALLLVQETGEDEDPALSLQQGSPAGHLPGILLLRMGRQEPAPCVPTGAPRLSASSQEKLGPPGRTAERVLGWGWERGQGWVSLWSLELHTAAPKFLL